MRVKISGKQIDQEQESLLIEVEDSGPGINDDLKSKIFQPFISGSRESRQKGGTGIGLSICKQIVEKRFKGSISFASECGKGTKFTVRVVVRLQNKSLNDEVQSLDLKIKIGLDQLDQSQKEKLRILIVDDDRICI